MSEENLELVKRMADAFDAGGIEAILPFFAPDAVAYPFPEWLEDTAYRGHEGLRAMAAVWTDNFDEFEISNDEFREAGDKVLILGETVGRIKGSGVPIRQPLGQLCSDIHDGLIGEARFFITWREALEAAGLSE